MKTKDKIEYAASLLVDYLIDNSVTDYKSQDLYKYAVLYLRKSERKDFVQHEFDFLIEKQLEGIK
jgi:hypothetical protein